MSKLVSKLTCFLLILIFNFSFTSSAFAAEPGLNLINNINSKSYVPNASDINWIVYTPGSPEELQNINFDVDNIVLRIHDS